MKYIEQLTMGSVGHGPWQERMSEASPAMAWLPGGTASTWRGGRVACYREDRGQSAESGPVESADEF